MHFGHCEYRRLGVSLERAAIGIRIGRLENLCLKLQKPR